MKHTTIQATTWTQDHTLEIIQNLRNDLIKDFLDERNLVTYFSERFNMHDLTRVKIEFMKKDLKQMLADPIDMTHYKELIDQINETCSASITEKYEGLFLKDVEKVLKKYNY
jgi:gamma-glutamylcysteine synthetase